MRIVADRVYPYVVFTGDSLTNGLYASAFEKAFRKVLENMIEVNYPNKATYYDFVAATGGKTDGVISNIDLLNSYNPDILFIEIGINDVGARYTIEQFRSNYQEILDGLAVLDRLVICGTIPWCNWNTGTVEYNLAVDFSNVIKEECNARGVPVADLWEVTVGKTDGISQPGEPSVFPPGYEGDNFHPNDLGHQRLADEFYRVLEPYLNLTGRRGMINRKTASSRETINREII